MVFPPNRVPAACRPPVYLQKITYSRLLHIAARLSRLKLSEFTDAVFL